MFTEWNSPSDIVVICIIGIFSMVFVWGALYMLVYRYFELEDKNYDEAKKNDKTQR